MFLEVYVYYRHVLWMEVVYICLLMLEFATGQYCIGFSDYSCLLIFGLQPFVYLGQPLREEQKKKSSFYLQVHVHVVSFELSCQIQCELSFSLAIFLLFVKATYWYSLE